MNIFADDIIGAADDIAENGKVVIWVKSSGDVVTPNPDEPWKKEPSTGGGPHFNVNIVFLPFDGLQRYWRHLFANTEIFVGDFYGLMAGNVPFEPSQMDKVIDDNKTYGIASINMLAPNGIPILYTIGFNE